MPTARKKRPYSGPSHSRVLLYRLSGRPTGRQIARGLGIPFGTCYFFQRAVPGEVIIRWGGAELPHLDTDRTINRSEAIKRTGKISTFRLLADADVPIPEWTTDSRVAVSWEAPYLGRTTDDRGGRGITIYSRGEVCGRHPLYTRLVENAREYRIHVVGDDVVSLQRKYLEYPHLDRHNGIIKNHSNGYAFKTPEKDLNSSRKEAAIAAVKALGLDFGAVDMVIDEEGKEYVLEVNSAPALSPMRVEQYLQALRPLLRSRS